MAGYLVQSTITLEGKYKTLQTQHEQIETETYKFTQINSFESSFQMERKC
jgi:hypothetical protein